ncbi:hypothetical protein CPB85DRAFT_258211 [Mucidula mucida]|nr:hypothetical protein CPB85DRAFT_258211 [Mucidula mucida]
MVLYKKCFGSKVLGRAIVTETRNRELSSAHGCDRCFFGAGAGCLGDMNHRRTRTVKTFKSLRRSLSEGCVQAPIPSFLYKPESQPNIPSFITITMAFSIIRNIIDKIAHTRRSSAITGPFGLLPQELLDLIIAHLGDDKVTLLSCALVHSTWTIISRYHLPSVMLVVSSPSRSKELVKLLRSSRETLSSSITGITLVGDIPFDDIDMDGKSPRAQSYRKLFQVLKAKHVALRSGMAENDPSLVWLFAQHFPDLSELQVTCASYQDIRSSCERLLALSCGFRSSV